MKIYVVRPGDSIWTIAKENGVSTESIINANGLQNSTKLVVGQTLVIPSTESAYRVRPGDSIWSIARKFNVAESIGNRAAIDRAAARGAEIKYDETAQSPHYNYFDDSEREHVVWFEDARSVEAKYKLVNEYGLRGVSYWVLAQPFPQNWQVLDDMFHITKVIK